MSKFSIHFQSAEHAQQVCDALTQIISQANSVAAVGEEHDDSVLKFIGQRLKANADLLKPTMQACHNVANDFQEFGDVKPLNPENNG